MYFCRLGVFGIRLRLISFLFSETEMSTDVRHRIWLNVPSGSSVSSAVVLTKYIEKHGILQILMPLRKLDRIYFGQKHICGSCAYI